MNANIEHLVNNTEDFSEIADVIEASDDNHKLQILAYYITEAAFEDNYALDVNNCHKPLLEHYKSVLTMLDDELISVDTENFVRDNKDEILDLAVLWVKDLLNEGDNYE